ncbi:hypothetical protein D3C80_1593870 [compost metagenome]
MITVISPLMSLAASPSGAAVASVPVPVFPAFVAATLSALLLFDEQPANKPAISVSAAKLVTALVFFIALLTPLFDSRLSITKN